MHVNTDAVSACSNEKAMLVFLWCQLGYTFCHPVLLTIIGTILLTTIMCLRSLLRPPDTAPHLFYRDSTLAKYVLKRCPRIQLPVDIPIYMRNAHVQTLLSVIMPKPFLEFDRKYLELKDGGAVALDWVVPETQKLRRTAPVLLVVPGFAGCAENCSFICRRALQRGFRVVVFNKRGHGGSLLTSPKLQSLGDPNDLRQVVKYIRSMFPGAKVVGIGYSVGADLLLSYLGEYGSSAHITAGACICPTYEAENFFTGGIMKPYELLILLKLKYLVSRHAAALSKVVDVDGVFKCNSLVDYEDRLYRHMYGYRNMSQYWERNCPMRDIDEVSTPVLCINSYDDPVSRKENIPFDLFRESPNFLLAACEQGGHCGFLHGRHLVPWADKLALDYVGAVLDFMAKYN